MASFAGFVPTSRGQIDGFLELVSLSLSDVVYDLGSSARGEVKEVKRENATAVIWKMMMLAEKKFRKLNAPGKLNQVFLGAGFRDGVEIKQVQEKELATV